MRHSTCAIALLGSHVIQEFGIECSCISLIHRSRAEDLCISCPAHSLITLWAVGRHVNKVPTLSPNSILRKTIDQCIARIQHCRLSNIRTQHTAEEILQVRIISEAGQAHIPEPVKCKVRTRPVFVAIADICIFLFCSTQIILIKASVLQDLPILQLIGVSIFTCSTERKISADFLPKIKHSFTSRCVKDLGRNHRMCYSYRQAQTLRQTCCP